MRQCERCGEVKPLEEFRDTRSRSFVRHGSNCRACKDAILKRRRERAAEPASPAAPR